MMPPVRLFQKVAQWCIALGLVLCLTGCSLIELVDRPDSGLQAGTGYGKTLEKIQIEGARHTREDVIRRMLVSKVGEPYTRQHALEDYSNLDRLRVFSSIQFDVAENGDAAILTIRVTENNPYTPSANIGITDENGVTVGVGATSGNFLGSGTKLLAKYNLGGSEGFRLNIRTPWYPGRRLMFVGSLSEGSRRNKTDDFNEKAYGAFFLVQRNMGRRSRLGGIISLLSIDADRPGITLNPNNRDDTRTLGVFVGYDSRDLLSDPRRGAYIYLDLNRTGGPFGGDGDYWRTNLDARGYVKLGNRHVLGLFSLTTLTSGTVGIEIPVWDDFHIGGTNSVRGWRFNQRIGKNQLINTLEYRYLLVEPKILRFWFFEMDIGVQLTAFWDSGTAWNTEEGFRRDFITGFGAGLRLLLPAVNMARFDIAVGQPGIGLRLHIGTGEKADAQRARVR